MECLHRSTELAWVSADLVQRDEAMVAIEGRVLHTLGHNGGRELLETPCEFAFRCAVVLHQEQLANKGHEVGFDVRAVAKRLLHGERHPAPIVLGVRALSHISPVDGQRRGDLANGILQFATCPVALEAVLIADFDQQGGQALEVGRKVDGHHFLLGAARHLGEWL